MGSSFFALFARMKYINRWALMKNVSPESLSQHSFEVAAAAHALAVIGNRRLGKNYDAAQAALMGLFHDMPEIITGDMPTPVKYYNADIRRAYGNIEKAAQKALLNTLPEDLRPDYETLLSAEGDGGLHRLVKAADKLSALIKCMEEKKSGNTEFIRAEEATRQAIADMHCEEADIFIKEFLGGFSLVLDNILSEN